VTLRTGAAAVACVLACASPLLVRAAVDVPQAARGTLADAPAPALRARSVTGESIDLTELLARGPVVVDFWATWCKPCIQAMPELERLHQTYAARGVTVIGVSEDGPRNYSKVRPFASRMGITFALVLDEDGRMQDAWQVPALPTTFVVGADGHILHVQQGYRPGTVDAIEQAVRAALGDSAVERHE
jgi:peroxiredoxin